MYLALMCVACVLSSRGAEGGAWKGTAQVDERRTVPWEGLARRVGLDADEWQVVGFSISGGERRFDLRIAAAPRDVWENYDRDDGGEIEVTEFLVHDVDPLEILSQMTHMFELKMLIRGLSGDQVRVKAVSDLPKELFVDENFGPQED
jgi:hypothetical protein